jgi:putative mRNA 3-end processing factor
MKNELLKITQNGIYCPAGGFYIDPWRGVERAVITHGHADHARWGSQNYLASTNSREILYQRLGKNINLQTVDYGQPTYINSVKISLHPAGHLLGSSQIRVEYRGEVWVVSGDYKLAEDKTCASFEPLKCHTFITESTFGLPIYRWQPTEVVMESVNNWWRNNAENDSTSILFAYALGKAQRILAELDDSIGTIYTHGAVEKMNECYRSAGIKLPQTTYVGEVSDKKVFVGGIVIAPGSGDEPSWLRKFPKPLRASASGWMAVRGNRRRKALDRGIVLSDHADWEGILSTIEAAEAENIWVTHGYSSPLIRYLKEKGLNAFSVETPYNEEGEDNQ